MLFRSAQPDELADVRRLLSNLPASGAIVTPERHKLSAIGLEAGALNAMPYLKHFLERILAGLGMSTVGMGAADTSNKSTALVVSAETRQTAEYMQDVVKRLIDNKIIKELLAEGGFDTTNGQHHVEIRFPNINKEERRAQENHTSQLWAQNLLTETESRAALGYQAITNDQRIELHANLYPHINTSKGANAQAQNKGQPVNQYGTLPAKPEIPKRDELLEILQDQCSVKQLKEFVNNDGIAQYLIDRMDAMRISTQSVIEKNHLICAISMIANKRLEAVRKI